HELHALPDQSLEDRPPAQYWDFSQETPSRIPPKPLESQHVIAHPFCQSRQYRTRPPLRPHGKIQIATPVGLECARSRSLFRSRQRIFGLTSTASLPALSAR